MIVVADTSVILNLCAGLLPAVRPVLETLQRDAQFWLSTDLAAEVLRRADEA